MNDMTIGGFGSDSQTQRMTSSEIAALVEKRHDNVKRTIETLVERGVIASPQIEEKPTAGRKATDYVFIGEQGKRDSIIVVAQLCPEFTARLVDRWAELETALRSQMIALPQDYFSALRALADESERTLALPGLRLFPYRPRLVHRAHVFVVVTNHMRLAQEGIFGSVRDYFR